MDTTYFLSKTKDSTIVVRATTKQAKQKLSRLASVRPDSIEAVAPKEAKELIAKNGGIYWKIKDII